MLVSSRKCYLSGSDWVINSLDHLMKMTTCSGNMSQIVLMLDSPLDGKNLSSTVNSFAKNFPVLQGRVARDFKLTPYWKIPAACDRDVTLNVSKHTETSTLETFLPLLEQSANSRFADEREHLSFHLFNSSRRSALAMTFDHRLLDARGAELFLNLFQQTLQGKGSFEKTTFTSSMELTRWGEKFLAGRNVNRRIISLSRSIPRSFSLQPGIDKSLKYRLLNFTSDETSAILDRACSESGYLMESPFFLAVITQAIHELFSARSDDGSSYLIPVTTDLRSGQDILNELFFNHVSFLFYQIPVDRCQDMKELISQFKLQMYENVKSGFPRDLAKASLLTRIVPLQTLGRIIRIPMSGKIATFAFSHLGKSIYDSPSFMGGNIDNLFHMPRVPVPPGIGFFTNIYNKRLNLVISYLDKLLSEDEITLLEEGILKRFGVTTDRNRFSQN